MALESWWQCAYEFQALCLARKESGGARDYVSLYFRENPGMVLCLVLMLTICSKNFFQ